MSKVREKKRTTITRKKVGIAREKAGLSRSSVKLNRQTGITGRNAPNFESVFDDGNEAMFAGAEFETGDLQADSDAIMSEALRAVIERKKATQERFRVATDPDFYLCLCFQSREQKEEFLSVAGWESAKGGGRFLNGLEVARLMGIPLEVTPIEPLKLRGRINRYKPNDILRKGGE